MDQNTNITPDYAASLVEWWAMAGVQYDCLESPVNWLEPEPARQIVSEKTPETVRQHQNVQANIVPNTPIAAPIVDTASWPQSLEALTAALAQGAALPGNCYGGKSAIPAGKQHSSLMIIGDLPDDDEINAGQIAQGASGQLLSNMLKAIGLDITACFITALATTRPGIGELPEGDATKLAPFMLHQIELVKPKQILILGSAACMALLNADLAAKRGCLENINQDGEKVSAITTFHPRTLLAQPMLKATAWKDLLMLKKKGNL